LLFKLAAALFDQVNKSFTVCRTELRSAWLSECRSFPVATNESVNTANLEELAFESDGAPGPVVAVVWVDKGYAPFGLPPDSQALLFQPRLKVGIGFDFLTCDGVCNGACDDRLEIAHILGEPMSTQPNGPRRIKVLWG
jgi:hypothetical protein